MLKNRYLSANEHYRRKFGGKVYKLALDGGMTCPNRDGTLDTRGCIFCSKGGSGEFAEPYTGDVSAQIARAVLRISSKTKADKYIAYFQNYTNTYAPADKLERLFGAAAEHPSIVALSVGTRPDCLPDEAMRVLERINKRLPVYVELGLQTIHEDTAQYIRRGYKTEIYDDAVKRLHDIGINVITHLIIGLPGENKDRILQSVRYAAAIGTDGIKLQLLHVLKNTDLESAYLRGEFRVLEPDEYADILCSAIELLPAHVVVHRITGDPPKKLLVAPQWSANKKVVLAYINDIFEKRNIIQGRHADYI